MSCQGRIALEARCGPFVFLTPTAPRRFKKETPAWLFAPGGRLSFVGFSGLLERASYFSGF